MAVYIAGHLYFRLAGLDVRRPVYGSIETFVWPLYVFAGGVFAINSWLVAIALSFERGTSAFSIWRRQFLWLAATYLASASIAAILVTFTNTLNWALVGLLLPLIAVSFIAIRTTLGRLDDANQHLTELNQLYLSTIETLAMAVDAKDQVTHGHIRRVQKFAVELAKSLGVTEERQLKAIEAAALLHDMGKLAIPEFILNKPGKLTADEFDIMKTHAALGADILSAIQFPYPVVPIVRHHHENWDGTGYPDGVKGSAIPIGARILSVVDCYDALTSDRPYRPAMADEQAVSILIQRRGSMYDPLVVDTFVREYPALKLQVERDTPITALPGRPTPVNAAPLPIGAGSSRDELLACLRVLATLTPAAKTPSLEAVCRDLVANLRGVATFDTAVVYLVDESLLALESVYSAGSLAAQFEHVKIPMAEQLTGWVGAHRTPVWNSDAALDTPIASRGGAALASSMPLINDASVVGVLTMYSVDGQEVSVSQRRAIESLLPALGAAVGLSSGNRAAGIDCRTDTTRLAALSVLDSLLSHGRPAHGVEPEESVLAVYLSHISNDTVAVSSSPGCEAQMDVLIESLAASPKNRVLLRLTDCHLLVYAGGQASRDQVTADVSRAASAGALQTTSLSATWIGTSQLLQDAVRRIMEHSSTVGGRPDASRRVH